MQFRGSLTACIDHVAARLTASPSGMLSIVYTERGHYYQVYDDTDLLSSDEPEVDTGKRLVFRGTFGELRRFVHFQRQRSLPLGGNGDSSKNL